MATLPLTDRAPDLLADLAGPDASFREHQLEAVRDLVEDRARVLCVQRTGWGKSAVYFIATALLRERGAGPALIVSPLLALMRNQIAAAERLGHPRAHDQLDQPRRLGGGARAAGRRRGRPAAHQPRAPEQPAVPRGDAAAVRRARRAARGRRGALHLRLGPRLPARLPAPGGDARARCRRASPCCARRRRPTTASWPTSPSSSRVGHAGTARPTAARSGARACASRWSTCPARPTGSRGWPRWSRSCPGSGIVYTLTKRDAELVAEWLTAHGDRRPRPTAARSTSERRVAVEERLLRQRAQGGRRHQRAGHGLRQARPRLRRALPGARARSSPTTSRSAAPGARSSAPTSCCCAAPRTGASRTSSSSRRSRRASASSACSRRSARTARRRPS